MSNWRDEYIQALSDRDLREKEGYSRINEDFIGAYTSLLDRTAALEAEKAAAEESKTAATDNKTGKDPARTGGNTQLRSDLAEALRSNGQLQSRVRVAEAELKDLKIKTKSDSRRLEQLERERAILQRKVRDRDEEISGKTRLVETVQDEMISLNLQLNMSEQTVKKLKAENKELIDRWMERKGREADEMNKTLG